MLLPDNIHPKYSIYYNGGLVLEELKNDKEIEFLDLYQRLKEKSDISFSLFVFTVDWLYLVDIAYLDKDGVIRKCS